MDCTNLKVGDKLYYKTNENPPVTGWATITFVGRKYFQVDVIFGNQLIGDPFKRPRYVQFYPDEQCYLDELRRFELTTVIRKSLDSYPPKLTLDQLEQIIKIIEGNQNEIR